MIFQDKVNAELFKEKEHVTAKFDNIVEEAPKPKNNFIDLHKSNHCKDL